MRGVRLLCLLVLAGSLICATGVALGRPNRGTKTISYRGHRVRVPRSWPVYHLAEHPGMCVRLDRPAVYLGRPAGNERCPSHAAGRREAIVIEPRGNRGATAGRRAHTAAASAHAAAATFTGLGFDACSAPSPRAMAAWASSPYRAVGIYVGGANSACAQPNLNATWVSQEIAAGWHLIPTYVGLQAPSNSCGCAPISPGQAPAQGTAAADDAVADAQALGLGPGSPIYDDMEAYSRTQSNTSTVLAFLGAWTTELHAKGYVSGVYSSAGSGVTDLVNQYGTGYTEPDDIWIADWNGEQTTSDPYVPAADWSNHQRLHQYRGGHNETYGGVTINIDSNYLDGATAASAAGPPAAPPPPSLSVSPAADGTTRLQAKWSGGSGLSSWRVLAGSSPTALGTVTAQRAHGYASQIIVRSSAPYFAVAALGSSGQVLATSSPVALPSHVAIFGHSAFVNGNGFGGIPAGCYTNARCHLTTTIAAGRAIIARTGTESIAAGSTGILYFRLTSLGGLMLAQAPGGRLAVQVRVRDVGGRSVSVPLTLIGFTTTGRGPRRGASQSAPIQVVGTTHFAPAFGMGGILAACATPAPCQIAAKLAAGPTTIASTRPELVGGDELGYVFFSLSPQGRALLARATGNQLGVNVTLTAGANVARASIALVRFS